MLKITKLELSGGAWHRSVGNIKETYDVPTLVQFAKEKNYKPFDLPTDAIDLSWNPFDYNNILDFAKHVKRVDEVSLSNPILIDDLGTICDGWHRVVKSILLGKKYIKAIRLDEMPLPSKTEKI